MKAEATPWRALLAAAHELGVPPQLFWKLSLKEWRALSTSVTHIGPLARRDFNSLSLQFPDFPHDHS
jgi:hypothetical protein